MNRRRFVTAAAVAAVGLGIPGGEEARAGEYQRARSEGGVQGKQILELRTYTFASAEKMRAFADFMASGMVPALNRSGITPVGVFQRTKADNPDAGFEGETSLELFVLLPHSSAESVATLDARLAADAKYAVAARDGMKETQKDPAFTRCESSLMLAFDQAPKVEAPTKAAGRVLQLRIYEAHNPERNRRKVHMFNEGGEIRIFREVGMHPVFFGHAFAGTRLPNLTYMLGFENDAAMKEAWGKFVKHPDWLKIKDAPEYRETVSRITNMVLRPAGGSQI